MVLSGQGKIGRGWEANTKLLLLRITAHTRSGEKRETEVALTTDIPRLVPREAVQDNGENEELLYISPLAFFPP